MVTHGNGPQVGSQLLRSEIGSSQTYSLPLDVCVAMTQGEIGYILQNALQSVLRERGLERTVTTLITQVVVDKGDSAFQRPTKPIGPFYSKQVAEQKRSELGWNIVEDAARGFRRVVASPRPLRILELDVIEDCLQRGMIVIASGGGGIPVVEDDGTVRGIEAVIDKDRASSLLAQELGIARFAISTDVEHVFVNYKKPDQMVLRSITLPEAKFYLNNGHFAEGSMRPKIEAAIEFLDAGGSEVIITDPEHLTAALAGSTGTHLIRK